MATYTLLHFTEGMDGARVTEYAQRLEALGMTASGFQSSPVASRWGWPDIYSRGRRVFT